MIVQHFQFPPVSNEEIARQLDAVARLLESQSANPFRVGAYRNGAATVRRLDRSVTEILTQDGVAGLRALPGIGEVLAAAILEIVILGRLSYLERLRGEADPERLLASIPGIGRTLARRLHRELGIDSLEDLEAAAYSGRLAAMLGPKLLEGVKDVVAGRMRRWQRGEAGRSPSEPPVEELLDVDREYREKATEGRLEKLAPRRFNPKRESWLPLLRTKRGRREYTALFSNTAQAHRLGKTRDWVVLYFEGGQVTVVTAERGRLAGRRVVRGRELETRRHYERTPKATGA